MHNIRYWERLKDLTMYFPLNVIPRRDQIQRINFHFTLEQPWHWTNDIVNLVKNKHIFWNKTDLEKIWKV